MILVAALIWGYAFVPQKMTVIALPPLSATALRFCMAAPLACLLANRRLLHPGVRMRHAVGLGVVLTVVYLTQTAALVWAPVARVSLITGMYAVFVPLFAPLLRQPRPTAGHWAGVVLAVAGLLALTGVLDRGGSAAAGVPLNIGDLLVLVHAVVSAFQVLFVGRLARHADPFALNAVQLVVVAVISVPAALVVDGVPHLGALGGDAWAAFGYLAVFSTVVAFTCQIVGQRHASAPTAALIMLLEAPLGVAAAVVFFDEAMRPVQWLGAAILLGGVGVSLAAEVRRARGGR